MGEIVSKVFHHYPNGFGSDLTNPGQRDWITKHAELSRFSLVECERLWERFQQLGCDENGVITATYLKEEANFKNDVFTKNLLLAMVGGDVIHFHTFLNVMVWVKNATVDDKCKAIFAFFNNGNSLGKHLFFRVVKLVYPNKDEETITRYVDVVYKAISPDAAQRHGELTYEDFLRICNTLPPDALSQVLGFDVLPAEISEELKQKFSPHWRGEDPNKGKRRDTRDEAIVCGESINKLAHSAEFLNDWRRIIQALGFSDIQIARFDRKYSNDEEKVRALLTSWKDLQEEDASVGVLQSALPSTKPELRELVYGFSDSVKP